MKFRTEYKVSRSSVTLDPDLPVALVGSCFASNIASRMRECMWEAFNGVGTLYNPMSIAKVVQLLVFGDTTDSPIGDSIFESEGRFHSWLFDSHFSASDRQLCLDAIEAARTGLLSALEKGRAMIVTFGTAWCYSLVDRYSEMDGGDGYIVANCHKMPASMFERKRVAVEDISSLWKGLCARLKERYPDLNVIFTVSPVRHLKDGFEGNTLSKATLHLAVEQICGDVPFCRYFPAYELVCDDLRDYRFYASDLVHPSESAIEYIWEVFCNTFLDAEGERKIKEGSRRYKALNHRPIMKV